MSESQKHQRHGATAIKNPLLSASVTGLSFDDFPNKPLLLPAAPAIVHLPVPPVTTSGLVAREPKSLVTVGSSSLDTESLDEINLNSSYEDNQTSVVTDPNANPLLEPTNQGTNSDSILSQAASSFSALPTVASNVFSTFSKRITAISNSRESTPLYDQYQQDSNANTSSNQLEIQPQFVQQSHQGDLPQAAEPFYSPNFTSTFNASSQQDIQRNFVAPEPPKFYTPADVPPVPSVTAVPPTNSSGQNNFRFSSKKKLYAPIPGLSDQIQKPTPTLDTAGVNSPIPPSNYYSQSQYPTVEEQKPEERRGASGLFSKITNLAPTGVLQNITGLVQSATGSLTQATKTDFYQENPPPVFDQQNNFFVPPPPSSNYFVPTANESSLTIAEQNTTQDTQPRTQAINTGNPFQLQQSQSQIPVLDSSNLPVQTNPSSALESTQPSHDNRPPTNLSSAQLSSAEPSLTTYFNTNQSDRIASPSITAPQISFCNPTNYLPQNTETSVTSQTHPTSHSLPPTIKQNIPPPVPPTTGHTSYRLQKGTKLYKSPLTALETTPIQLTPTQIPSVNTYSSQETQSVALFAPPPIIEAFKQGPNLVAESLPSQSEQSVPLFVPLPLQTVPSANDIKSKETAYSLVNPQVQEPPIKKLKSDDPLQDIHKSISPNDPKSIEPQPSGKGVELIDNKFVSENPKQDSKQNIIDNNVTQLIFDPIEPVIEENITEIQKDPLEETLQKLSLAESSLETKTVKLPPIGQSFNLNNPYRRASASETGKTAPTLPTLATFFVPEPSQESSELNFFANLPSTQPAGNAFNFFSEAVQDKEVNKENLEPAKPLQSDSTNFFTTPIASELTPLEPDTAVHPPISAFFPTSEGSAPAILEDNDAIIKHLKNVPPPIGFENILQSEDKTEVNQEATSNIEQPEIVNRFANYFNQANQEPEIVKNPSTFFDSFPGQQITQAQQQQPQQQQLQQEQPQLELTVPSTVVTNEEQRIQYFFNNPPPKDASHVGDLNYDLVHSGLGIKNLQQRSLTPISNLVEPPSSACSEFSEISNSTAGQKSIAANLSLNESSDKLIEKEEINKSLIEEQDSAIVNSSNSKDYEELLQVLGMANFITEDKTTTSPVASMSYKPAVKHWFFRHTINDKQIWAPFSHYDSALLETSLLMEGDEKVNLVAVEGGRYDVNISERKKMSVYWESDPIEVRRCSWFYKAIDSKYVPYEEQVADLLESEYKKAAESGIWHKTVPLEMGEQVVFHGPTVIVHFQQQHTADAWGGTTQTATRPRVVKRDLDDFHIEQGESQKVDHLLFMVHGIGSVCDLKMRTVEEVVEDFRTIARQLVQSHYKNSTDLGLVGRVEVLPISWHSHLHSAEMGIDEKLRMITLDSIPKLRNFTNDTLLDVLFYTSPTYCQKIMNTIVSSMNTLYLKYRQRHPEFNGGVSLAGHSLGSLIIFDLLCHQNPIKESEEKNMETPDQFLEPMDSNQLEDKQISYKMGPAGTGQPFIDYGQLIFQPKKFFALGSPIGMFVTIRGIDKLGLDFRLPTCPGFYNIFHPYDPVAYRIEALVNPDLSGVRPVLIPHHKGRKRMHLELKETMTRVSMDLKTRFLDKFKTTLDSVNIFGSGSKTTKEAEELMEKEVDKVIQMQIQMEQQNHNKNVNEPSGSNSQAETTAAPRQRTDSVSTAMSDDIVEIDFPLGKLNDSKRIDYVLQEAPLEFFNEYIFALSSHVCYWDSEDTILFVMKEIYSGLGISPDSQVPQQTMTIERPSSRNSLLSSS